MKPSQPPAQRRRLKLGAVAISPFAHNHDKEPVNVRHAELERLSGKSRFKSVCPVCGEGVLIVMRGPGFRLRREDRCGHCLQPFIYDDVSIGGEALPFRIEA
jgi:hypothetical protein